MGNKRRPVLTPSKPRRKVRETEYFEEETGPPADDVLTGLDDLDPDEESVRSIVAQFGGHGDVEVKVYKLTPTGKEYCYTDGPNVTEETIKAGPYGANGGRFLLHVMIDGQLRRSFPVSIAAPVRPGGGDSGAPNDALIRALERIESRLTAPQTEPMSAVLNAAVGLINSQAVRPPDTTMDQMIKMAELVASLRGSAADDDSFGSIVKSIVREAAPVVLPGLLGRPGAPTPIEGGQPMQDEIMLRQGIGFLKKKCMLGSDPNLYLEFILDNADDPRHVKLIQLAATQPFEVFTRLDAEIAQPPFRAYFEFIYNGLRSAATSAYPLDVDSSGTGGNAADAPPNGATRKRGPKSG